MISIVCSTQYKNDEYAEYLQSTCGVKDVEILLYVNDGKWSLSELYNKAMKEAKYDRIVFVHDDIIFNTEKWGLKVINNFNSNPDIGIFGVAGTPELGLDGCWWTLKPQMKGIVNHSDGSRVWTSKYSGDAGNKPIPVVLIDGVFMAVDRSFDLLPFDEDFKGFHFYDIPFSVRNYEDGVNLAVFTNIRITHLSVGVVNKQWDDNRKLFIQKYKSLLPLVLHENN